MGILEVPKWHLKIGPWRKTLFTICLYRTWRINGCEHPQESPLCAHGHRDFAEGEWRFLSFIWKLRKM